MRRVCFFFLLSLSGAAYGMLAGGRPNTFSEGNNAFAGVVNPANAVWIKDRFDLGAFWVYQKSSMNNQDDNPIYPPGKTDLTYRSKNLFTTDLAIHKQLTFKSIKTSFSIASYTMPSNVKLRTKKPIPIAGTTPMILRNMTEVISAVFSFKVNKSHSLGFSIDYLSFTHLREGYQRSDNSLRSVSPGNVTNRGMDHSHGVGLGVGYRWNITKRLQFGTAWTRKSAAGQYRKYRGFEPYHAKNYVPQTWGGGFNYRLTSNMAGRLEVLWSNFGNLPGANNSVLPNGQLNPNKRGSSKSSGPGLTDATYINVGLGYKYNSQLSFGAGLSHRIKTLKRPSTIISHSYRIQTIYNLLSVGANFKYKKSDLFLVFAHGFKNRVSGDMPDQLGGGRFVGEKQTTSLSISWGYMY